MTAPATTTSSLRRSLTVWQAVGLSVALMAPSPAANINPQGTRFFPVVAFGWLALVTVVTVALATQGPPTNSKVHDRSKPHKNSHRR